MYKSIIFFVLAQFVCFVAAKSSKPAHVKILVLGAGAAGIKAAETLYRKGEKDFLVLEGKDYIGGRVHHINWEGNMIPLGAGWIHGIESDNPVWDLAQKLHLNVHYDNYTDFVVRDGANGKVMQNAANIYKKLKRIANKVDAKMENGSSDVPMKATLAMLGWKASNAVQQALEFYHFDFENGVSPRELSSNIYSITGLGKDVIVTDPRGYAFVLEYLAKPFYDKIKFNTVVTKIKRSKNMVIVNTKNGIKYTADHVLVTFSSGVLINDLVKFIPLLPKWKMDTIHLTPMCHYCKVFMKFPSRFWDENNYILFAQKTRGDRVHWQNFDKPTLFDKEHILMLTLTGDLCVRSQKMNDKDVGNEAMEALRKVYGINIPAPTAIIRNHWSNDPMTMGSYSSPVIGFDVEEGYKKLQAAVGRVWFAGEYTTEDYGYVHGALVTGQKTALRMLMCIRGNMCPVYKEKRKPKCVTKLI